MEEEEETKKEEEGRKEEEERRKRRRDEEEYEVYENHFELTTRMKKTAQKFYERKRKLETDS